ncbi:MAG: hypothetical protein VW891_06475, partial [Novosphingobium sp.]
LRLLENRWRELHSVDARIDIEACGRCGHDLADTADRKHQGHPTGWALWSADIDLDVERHL